MICRVSVSIRGAVQGVGFRPFIYKLADELHLNGFVLNDSSGVSIEAEGEEKIIRRFIFLIEKKKPSLAIITSFEYFFLDPHGYKNFVIRESGRNNDPTAIILPDISVCDDCLKEMWNPSDRRYLYPFINCTNCGPRFSIIESLPYDRPNTSMKIFMMCDQCREEYDNPQNRRFHAQPIACPECGPHISLLDRNGKLLSIREEALHQIVLKIRSGQVIAIKGLGGFQLVCDATNDEAIRKLRKRKKRNEKPFALMIDSLNSVKKICHVSKSEERILLSPECPIVLLKVKERMSNVKSLSELGESKEKASNQVAPNNPYLGIMLPYTPLHHLLMRELKIPIIATSGNLSEEPICIDNRETLERLHGVADYFLVHNRSIVRHVDDSIARVVMNREMIIRRARGYAPLPLMISESACTDESMIAVGAHLKNTIAFKKQNQIFVSQHIGDLSTKESIKAFETVIKDFQRLYDLKPKTILSDRHPDYISTKYAQKLNTNIIQIQHHAAHVAACRLENQVTGEALGVSWDGTGYGDDGTVWGGEFFLSADSSLKHIAQFKKFKLPGGEIAIQEPRRSLAGMFYEIGLIDNSLLQSMFKPTELKIISSMLADNFNSPVTSSVGRIFDSVSALLGLCYTSEYEGHAAMLLEFIANDEERKHYEFELIRKEKVIVDWKPIIEGIIVDKNKRIHNSIISAKFHNTLAYIILGLSKYFKLNKILLSGGCFQNKLLLERTIRLLSKKDKKVYWHQRIPTNDGGISVGQIAAHLIINSTLKKN